MRPEDFKPDDLFTQIQNLADKLAAERHAREAAERAKSELLAAAGHELKGPVESLIALTELLGTSPLDPAQRRYTDMIAQGAWRLLDVVNDLLTFARQEAENFTPQPASNQSAAQQLPAQTGREVRGEDAMGRGSADRCASSAGQAGATPHASQQAGGAAVAVGSPVLDLMATEAVPAKAARDDKLPAKLSGHVLVAEDNAVNRMLISTCLDEFGVSHEIVGSNGAALLNLAAKPYDLVLLDVAMPDLDGIEAAKRIRALRGPVASVAIIGLVAKAKAGEGRDYLAAGMNGCVTKPISERKLYAALAPFLSKGVNKRSARLAG